MGMRGQKVRVEARLDGGLALRYQGEYLLVELRGPSSCTAAEKPIAGCLESDSAVERAVLKCVVNRHRFQLPCTEWVRRSRSDCDG